LDRWQETAGHNREIEAIEKFAAKTQQPFSAISEQKPYSGGVELPQRVRQTE
jgi:hypothetical protein